MFSVKNVLSALVAVFIAIVAISLFVKIIGAALHVLFNLVFIVIIFIVALPLYIIIKKKLFK